MSLMSRMVPNDHAQRMSEIAASRVRLAETEASGGELIELSELIQRHNERNHYADRFREAYGRPRE